MKWTVFVAIGGCLLLSFPRAGAAQSALERLEELIRQAPEKPQELPAPPPPEVPEPIPAPAAAAPAPPEPGEVGPAAESGGGYLGVVGDDRNDRGRGVRVLEIVPGGPGAKAGLKKGDLITGIGDLRVRQMSDLMMILDNVAPGNTVPVKVLRDGQNVEVRATLAPRPASAGPRPPQLLPGAEPPLQPGPEAIPKVEPLPAMPPGGVVPAVPNRGAERIEALEQRIQALEQRVAELEKALAESKPPAEKEKPDVPEPPEPPAGPKLEAPE